MNQTRTHHMHMRSKSSFKRISRFLFGLNNFSNIASSKKFKKWRCPFFVEVSTFKIGNKFGPPPKSSMGTLFEPMILKNGTFLEFEAAISDWEVPQKHHLSQQHFGCHVAQKQHLLFLLPKIVDFINNPKNKRNQ